MVLAGIQLDDARRAVDLAIRRTGDDVAGAMLALKGWAGIHEAWRAASERLPRC
jgi:hypothetical protein